MAQQLSLQALILVGILAILVYLLKLTFAILLNPLFYTYGFCFITTGSLTIKKAPL